MPALVDNHIRDLIMTHGAREAYRLLIAENDALILGPALDNGRQVTQARTAIHTAMMADWAAEQLRLFGYDKPFAVVALGGTGREEMTPCSDTDFAFLFDDVVEGNAFLSELQRQVLHSGEFEARHGFACAPLPFNLEDAPGLQDMQLNAFLDMKPVYDPHDLSSRFRERIRSTYDPFEHFLHVSSFWREQWGRSVSDCERLDSFDIKEHGLRVFLAGIWSMAGKGFVHSAEIRARLDDRRDLDAYDFLLRIRAFIHLRRATHSQTLSGHHAEDVLEFEDFTAFGELLGPGANELARFEFAGEVRARLLAARRRVTRFTRGVIGRELQWGREIKPESKIVYGVGGMRHIVSHQCTTNEEKSRAALSLLVASQRYGLPIDPSELDATFGNAGDWLQPVPELGALFYDARGSVASSFEFLSQLDGAEERLFPGYAKYEASMDVRVLQERRVLRGALERRKLQALDGFVREGRRIHAEAISGSELTDPMRAMAAPVEAALLDPDHLAAVKLALKTKRLPLTQDDIEYRQDEAKPLYERFASGFSDIPLDDYYTRCFANCEFTAETLRITQFLVANRRALKAHAVTGLNDPVSVKEFVDLCQDEAMMRALFVFTCADRAEWESAADQPTRWFNIRELCLKARMCFHPGFDPTRSLTKAGYSREELEILQDFGADFFAGVYRNYANRFGAHLVRLAGNEPPGPRAALLREGASSILGVAAKDYRGLAATISGACWRNGIALEQAHLFSAMNHGLALDFFHLEPGARVPGPEMLRTIEDDIRQQLHTGENDLVGVPREVNNLSLTLSRPGLYCLRGETSGDVGALIFLLTYQVFRLLGGNVFGLTAHSGRGTAYVSVYHSMPVGLYLPEATVIIRERF